MQEGAKGINYMKYLGNEIYVHCPFQCVTLRRFVSGPYYDHRLSYPHCPTFMGRRLCPTKDGISLRVLEWKTY